MFSNLYAANWNRYARYDILPSQEQFLRDYDAMKHNSEVYQRWVDYHRSIVRGPVVIAFSL